VKNRSINVAVHVIFGLPGEGSKEIMQTMQFLARLRPDGIKIHNLHIPKSTPLADEYEAGEIVPPSAQRHLEYVIRALEVLPQDTLILRLTCDTRSRALIGPRNFGGKAGFYSLLRSEMRTRNTWQGKKHDPKQFYRTESDKIQ
jgi:radical SAM superfamily enzyme